MQRNLTPNKECPVCKTPRPENARWFKFCSKQCQGIGTRRPGFRCIRCSCDYVPKETRYDKFCSRICSDRFKRARSNARLKKIKAIKKHNKRSREELRKQQKEETKLKSQIDAFNKFGTKRTCRICGKTFGFESKKDGARGSLCSHQCRSKARTSNRRNFKAKHNAIRRQKSRRQSNEVVSREYILRRDNFRCQHCGRKTRPDFKITHSLYPNVDHIVPLCKGGGHNKQNLQCLCRECNIKKGADNLNDQLLLIG